MKRHELKSDNTFASLRAGTTLIAALMLGELASNATAAPAEVAARSNTSGALATTTAPKSVSFKNSSVTMAGNLYLPPGFEEGKKYAAIVAVHPGGGVKEQTAGLYAQKLAEQGFVTLAFDASHQGASGGMPRFSTTR